MNIYSLHIIYETKHVDGRYYRGRHSTNSLDDGYLGSGKWVKSIKDKSTLCRRILDNTATTISQLKLLEEKYILEVFDDPLNMNWTASGNGVGSDCMRRIHHDRLKLGIQCGNVDRKVYDWYHHDSGLHVKSTRSNLIRAHGLHRGAISRLISGDIVSFKGWSLSSVGPVMYNWHHVHSGTRVRLTQHDFIKAYSMCEKHVSQMVRGKCKSIQGWYFE